MHKQSSIAFKLALVSNVTLAVFAVVTVSAVLPIRLFNPLWIFAFVQTFIDNGINALMAVGFCWLSAYLDPDNQYLSNHSKRISNLCVLVVFGYILLIPLQIYSSYEKYQVFRNQSVQRYEDALKNIRVFEQQVRISPNIEKLNLVLKLYQSTEIPASQSSRIPLDTLKKSIFEKINQAKSLLNQKMRPDLLQGAIFTDLQIAIRNILLCFAYAIGFSAVASRRESESTLLQEWMASSIHILEARLRARQLSLIEKTHDIKNPHFDNSNDSETALKQLQSNGLFDNRWIVEEEHVVDPPNFSNSQEAGDLVPIQKFAPLSMLNHILMLAKSLIYTPPRYNSYIEHLAHPNFEESSESLGEKLGNSSEDCFREIPRHDLKRLEKKPKSSLNSNNIPDFEYFQQLADDTENLKN